MNSVITIDVALWGLVIGTVLPLLVGIITAQVADSGVKAVVLLALAAVISIGQEIIADGSFEAKAAALKFALLFLTSVGLHFGLLSPTRISGRNGAIQRNFTGGVGAHKVG